MITFTDNGRQHNTTHAYVWHTRFAYLWVSLLICSKGADGLVGEFVGRSVGLSICDNNCVRSGRSSQVFWTHTFGLPHAAPQFFSDFGADFLPVRLLLLICRYPLTCYRWDLHRHFFYSGLLIFITLSFSSFLHRFWSFSCRFSPPTFTWWWFRRGDYTHTHARSHLLFFIIILHFWFLSRSSMRKNLIII